MRVCVKCNTSALALFVTAITVFHTSHQWVTGRTTLTQNLTINKINHDNNTDKTKPDEEYIVQQKQKPILEKAQIMIASRCSHSLALFHMYPYQKTLLWAVLLPASLTVLVLAHCQLRFLWHSSMSLSLSLHTDFTSTSKTAVTTIHQQRCSWHGKCTTFDKKKKRDLWISQSTEKGVQSNSNSPHKPLLFLKGAVSSWI